ncbi:serine/threonine-protein kinase HipA [Aequitasia blattaphilus]|uniref:HipA domain-containing protein n=1 Tax=Aequitasia blattaphilus TaxID=2949332 RepID=A0ABT1EAL7_9FIRM|nr:HipA domain-containing protein [Aequitasia blattaphilus]MCP1102852.1 HipA domain-containing protein [Aequitasia blattaphilus]MCR8615492.1 HipA domain-containing protein [Aequitasia blattaphilus]
MMKCLYCGKIMNEDVTQEEREACWHSKCAKKFFGTERVPSLDISEEQFTQIANDTVQKGLTIPGVQKKISLHLEESMSTRLTMVDYPTGYILKPQTAEFRFLPEFENLAMKLAESAGIKTVPHGLVKLKNDYAYITRRIDRRISKRKISFYAMEDFCQLSNRLTQDKYRGSYEGCSRVIKKYSTFPGIDLSELFIRVVQSFIIGNSDMHLKNFSLIERHPGKRDFILSRAYDILPVNIIMPEDNEQLALTLNGKKRNLRKKDFLTFAKGCDMTDLAAEKILAKFIRLKEEYLKQCDESYLPRESIKEMKDLIRKRFEAI